MVLQEAIEHFLNFVQFEKKQSKHSFVAYQNDLHQFSDYLLVSFTIRELDAFNHLQIRSWLAHLMNEGLTARSISRKVSTLKSFYKFLMKQDWVKQNPMLKIVLPKATKKLPVFVEEKAMNDLLDQERTEDTFEARRNELILHMYYGTGMRQSELIGLRSSDVDLFQSQVKVLGKRSKERIIPMPRELVNHCKDFMEWRKQNQLDFELLFTGEDGKALYPRLIYRLVHQKLSEVSTLQKRSPHVLRHTYATHMLNHGAELNAIKELLGHSSLAATQVYTHNSIERLKQVYKDKHPRS